MKLRFPRFTLRRMLVAVGVLACAIAVTVQSLRVHDAVRLVESTGGDVWCCGRLYTGVGVGMETRSPTGTLCDRAIILGSITTKAPSDLWLCSVPYDRHQFARALALLNPQTIHFEVLGPMDYKWVHDVCPTADIYAVHGLLKKKRRNRRQPGTRWGRRKKTPVKPRSTTNMLQGLEQIDTMLAEDPQFLYRINRYEPLIGYPGHGNMGMLTDKLTGKIIYLPWPK